MQRAHRHLSLAKFTREAEHRKGIKATAHVWMFEVGHPNMAENCFQDAYYGRGRVWNLICGFPLP